MIQTYNIIFIVFEPAWSCAQSLVLPAVTFSSGRNMLTASTMYGKNFFCADYYVCSCGVNNVVVNVGSSGAPLHHKQFLKFLS